MRTFAQKPKATQQTTFVKSTISDLARIGQNREVDLILHLQRTVGNQAVWRLLQSKDGGNDKGSLISDSVRLPFASISEPVSNGSLAEPEEPFGEFNEEDAELGMLPPAPTLEETKTVQAATETTTGTIVPQTATVPRTVIRGPREMWNFNGERPAGYAVSSRLSTNRTGGTFTWSVSPQLTLSSPTGATPTVTTVTPSAARRDAWIRVRHTDAGGTRTAASYRLTILAPDTLTHLRDVDNPNAGFGYQTEIHYSISDQFGTTLPRNVPINERWSGPAVIDFPGGNWRRPTEGSATVNPADWYDFVTGVSAGTGFIPDPVAPTHADAAVAAQHWPGAWRVGSLTIGNGRRVSSVTWQRNRGFARHRYRARDARLSSPRQKELIVEC